MAEASRVESVKHKVYIELWDNILRDLMKTVPVMWDIHVRQSICSSRVHQCREDCIDEIRDYSDAKRRA